MNPGQLQTWVLKTTAFFSFPLHPPPPHPSSRILGAIPGSSGLSGRV